MELTDEDIDAFSRALIHQFSCEIPDCAKCVKILAVLRFMCWVPKNPEELKKKLLEQFATS